MAAKAAAKVAILTFSTRTPRVGPSVSQFIKEVTAEKASPAIEYETVDVADFKLPVFDEPILPAMVPAKGEYTKPHTKAWSAAVAKYAGYVFVTPEYNYGIPGATKNAIDFLYNEFNDKPALVVSYGIFGGKIASEALVKTLEGMKLRVVETRPTLPFTGGQGPDLFAAMLEGKLGDDTKKSWNEEQKSVILKGLEELEEKLTATVVPRKEGE